MASHKINNFGRFLKNPKKYQGDITKIYMRSGWEIKFALWLDKHPSIVSWNSEDVVIPYIMEYKSGTKKHRYFMDFWMKVEVVKGIYKEYLVEIKPQSQKDDAFLIREGKQLPKPKRLTKSYYKRIAAAVKNDAKWKATEATCQALQEKGRDINFLILTERDLPV